MNIVYDSNNSAEIKVKELEKQVGIDGNGQSKWKKDDAINRRKTNTSLLTNFIFGCKS